jgi:hypothetical protein
MDIASLQLSIVGSLCDLRTCISKCEQDPDLSEISLTKGISNSRLSRACPISLTFGSNFDEFS